MRTHPVFLTSARLLMPSKRVASAHLDSHNKVAIVLPSPPVPTHQLLRQIKPCALQCLSAGTRQCLATFRLHSIVQFAVRAFSRRLDARCRLDMIGQPLALLSYRLRLPSGRLRRCLVFELIPNRAFGVVMNIVRALVLARRFSLSGISVQL